MRNQKELLHLVRTFPEGIAVADLKDAYPTVMDDLQVFPTSSIFAVWCFKHMQLAYEFATAPLFFL